MAEIKASDVKLLREKTNCGMMDCKKALVEAEGDFEAAERILREKGLAKAASKAGRIAADGIVEILSEGNVTAMVEVNTETDFVAKNDTFKAFVNNVLKTIIKNKPADIDALKACDCEGVGTSVDAELSNQVAKIGEKIDIRRFVVVEGTVGTYTHGNGSAGVIVLVDADDAAKAAPNFATALRDVAMQVCSGIPCLFVDKDKVPADVLESEKSILLAQIANDPKNANKPDQIKEKMVLGKINKYYETNCLAQQSFVKDDSMTVEQYLNSVGGSIKLVDFYHYEKGEGIEKRQDDFVNEIASMIGGNK